MDFITVRALGNRSDVTLIREASGQLYVRRIIPAEKVSVYQTLQSLHAPHIPEIISITEISAEQYEVIEAYIEGQTLEHILSSRGLLPEDQAAVYITQLCDALEIVHKAGIIHRDIKPENIIITADDTLYLLDFDISRVHKRGQHADTDFMGTKGYAAPEQFGFQQTSVSTDIYAIGVVLNEMITGQLPQEALPYSSIRRIIIRCTDIDPTRRYRSVKQLKNALHIYLTKEAAPLVGMLRSVPGFRSWTGWKMIIAASFYVLMAASMIEIMLDSLTLGLDFLLYLVPSILLFFFIFDCFHLRSSVRWLRKAKSRFTYVLRCILFAIGWYLFLAAVWGTLLGLILY
ncbi:MAG: serine/threonine-protein kinase [Eubacteriales bacterium]|nr:serine/threonine-protein kinase [Eubacteriales bacterium]